MSLAIENRGYAHPEYLVSTKWVLDNLKRKDIRIIESNEDPLLYTSGHIPGAVEVDWIRDLNDPIRRDYLTKVEFESLCSRLGITPDTMVIIYGDKNNWWATYTLWIFQLFSHNRVVVMDGGRAKWENEQLPLEKEVQQHPFTNYVAVDRDDFTHRIFRDGVFQYMEGSESNKTLVDVRSPEEYSGEKLHMEGYPNEGSLRGGHIPSAKNIPWAVTINPEDGTFKTASELRGIYEEQFGLKSDHDIVSYCRIGERSSHTWFVLKYLLGYPRVRNYDGSWTEWGNLVGAPIEK